MFCSATLDSPDLERPADDMARVMYGKTASPFFLDYDYPAYSLSETRIRLGTRRETGHGRWMVGKGEESGVAS